MPISTSQSLLDQLRIYDEDGWRRFVRLYSPLINHWIARHDLQYDDRETVASEVFQSVFTSIGSFEEGSFRGWLRTITHRRAVDLIRKNVQDESEFEDIENLPSDIVSSSDYQEETEILYKRAVQLAAEHVAPHHWEIVQETLIRQRRAEEVAAEFGIATNTVYTIQKRVLEKLREFRRLIDPDEPWAS